MANVPFHTVLELNGGQPHMPNIIDDKDHIGHPIKHIHIPILIKPSLVGKHSRREAPNPAPKRILLHDPTSHHYIVPLVEAARHMRHVIDVLVIVDDGVVAVVRHDVGVEEADVADYGWLVDLDGRDVLLVYVERRKRIRWGW